MEEGKCSNCGKTVLHDDYIQFQSKPYCIRCRGPECRAAPLSSALVAEISDVLALLGIPKEKTALVLVITSAESSLPLGEFHEVPE